MIDEGIFSKVGICVLGYFLLQKISERVFPQKYLKKCNNDKNLRKEFHQRVLSFFNCILLTTSITYIHGVDIFILFTQSNKETVTDHFNNEFDGFSKLLLIQLSGYMILDTFWCWWNEYNSVLNYLHHFLTIAYCWSMLEYNDTLIEAMIGLFLSEFSNIFLNLYWFAQYFKWRSESVSGFGFVISFFISRIIGAVWLNYWLFTIPGSPPMRIISIIMCCVNAGFFYKILENLVKHFQGKGAKLE